MQPRERERALFVVVPFLLPSSSVPHYEQRVRSFPLPSFRAHSERSEERRKRRFIREAREGAFRTSWNRESNLCLSSLNMCCLTRTTLKIGDTTPALTETLANFNACVNEGGTGRKEGKSGASGPKVWCDAAARRGWRRRRLCFLLQ